MITTIGLANIHHLRDTLKGKQQKFLLVARTLSTAFPPTAVFALVSTLYVTSLEIWTFDHLSPVPAYGSNHIADLLFYEFVLFKILHVSDIMVFVFLLFHLA